MGWVDSVTIVVRAGSCGIGLFSAATGELRHRFQVTNEDHQVKSYTASALSFNSDYKIFSSCKGKNNKQYKIGVWDQLTGKQIEFYYDQYRWSLGEANRLQWLHGTC
ncbi:BTB/POZ domain-containing protein [Camellia lanceoleosa]|uniref:BTB/POZ domain-containing protein n=1 Tax=Camellia lanceoleosa TaxID=1840588 RepID=A0ACC0I382_9ERIC|nr:BTB/POZ domain-containing protein [Camellia lanceoleosa]